MPASFANVQATSGSAVPTYTSSAFTSVANRFYLLAVYAAGSTALPSSITSTNGITFTAIKTNVNTYGFALWGGLCTSGSSGTFTITMSSITSLYFSLDSVSGMATSGTVAQSVAAAGRTATLAALTGSNSVYAAYGSFGGSISTGSGYTQLGNAFNVVSEFKTPGTTTPSVTNTSPSQDSIIGVEIAEIAAPTNAANTTQQTLMLMGYGI